MKQAQVTQLPLFDTPQIFIDRDAESASLREYYDLARQGDGQVIFINGEPGIGKTSLVGRFIQDLLLDQELNEFRLGVARCSSIPREDYKEMAVAKGEGSSAEVSLSGDAYIPMLVALEMASSRFMVSNPNMTRAIVERVERFLRNRDSLLESISEHDKGRGAALHRLMNTKTLGTLAIDVSGLFVPEIAVATVVYKWVSTLFGKQSQVIPIDLQQRIYTGFLEKLSGLSRKHTVIVYLDDIQWADPASVKLMAHVIPYVKDKRILLIGVYRRSEVKRLALRGHPLLTLIEQSSNCPWVRHIIPEPFDEPYSKMVLQAMMAEYRYPDSVTEHLLRLAAGNPLYLTLSAGFLKKKIDSSASGGMIIGHDKIGEWIDKELPKDIRGLLRLSISDIDTDILRALERGSVEGQTFHTKVVGRLMTTISGDINDEFLLDRLKAAENLYGIIRAGKEQPGDPFLYVNQFTHAIVQQAFYYNLSAEERKHFHLEIAQILEEELGDKKWGYAGRIADHYILGHDWQKALEYLLMSARSNNDISTAENSLIDVQKGTEILLHFEGTERNRLAFKAGLNFEKGRSLALLGRTREAMECYTEVNDSAFRLGDIILQAKVSIELSHISRITGDPERADRFTEALFSRSREINDIALRSRLIEEAYVSARRLGHKDRENRMKNHFLPLLGELLEDSRRNDSPEIEAYCLCRTGQVYTFLENYPRANTFLEKAQEASLRCPVTAVTVLLDYAFLHLFQRTSRIERLESGYLRLLEHAEKHSPVDFVEARRNYAEYLQRIGRLDEAVKVLLPAYKDAMGIKNNELMRLISGSLSAIAERHGDLDLAYEAARVHLREAEVAEVPSARFGALMHLAQIMLEKRDTLQAETYYSQALIMVGQLAAIDGVAELERKKITLELIGASLDLQKGNFDKASAQFGEIKEKIVLQNDLEFTEYIGRLFRVLGLHDIMK